ncbi:MAG: ATP phosphoribosyltransferase regulatory subunit [Pseudomonadota bacterium]|nr:ATP phosphoribosyltransferase regulatory subunit [Pseudomonadota bacterium]
MNPSNVSERWMLPAGVEEILPPRARALDRLSGDLVDLYWSWGYDLVMPPLIEYLESLLTGTGRDLDLHTFKLTDQVNGRLMGVRADITPQVARIDAHVLGGEAARRLCYIGSVLHTLPGGFSGSRSPLQVGAELFGHSGIESDLEVLSLMLETLTHAAVEDIHIDIGHVGIYRGLVQRANLSNGDEAALFEIMQRKALPELERFLDDRALPEDLAAMLAILPELNGGVEVVGRARATLSQAGPEVLTALADIDRLVAAVTKKYPKLPVHVDLAELRGYGYHTGIVFAAFQPGRGQDVARGGRYDHIGEVFGRARPATGFSADLETLLLCGALPVDTTANGILVPALDDAELTAKVRNLRADGERVVQVLSVSDDPVSLGCDRQLVRKGDSWRVVPIGEVD